MAIEVVDGKMKLKRELKPGGSSIWSARFRLCSPFSRYHKVPLRHPQGIMAAKKKELNVITRESLGVSIEPTQALGKIYVAHQDQEDPNS